MANYENLKTAIQQVIYENGNQEITGSVMQATLLAMVNSLGAGYQFIGIATPSMNPGTPDQNVFYLAGTAGTYVNFGNIVLDENEFAILKYNGSWTKDVTGLASAEKVDQLSQEVDGYEGERKVVKDVSSISYVSRYIRANNTWNSGNSSRGIFIPVTPGKKYGILYTNLNAEESTHVAVVRDASTTIGALVNYATGFGRQVVTLNDEYTFTAPEDAAYVFIMIRYGSTTAFQYTVYEYDTYHVGGVIEKVADIQPKVDTLLDERNAEQIAFPVNLTAWSNTVIESGGTFRNSYYIVVSTGKWNSGSNYLSTRFPVFDARRVKVTPGGEGYFILAFLKNMNYSLLADASFCDGYSGVIRGTEATEYIIPADCKYLYIYNTANGTNVTPESVILYYDKTEAVQRRRPIVSFIDDDGQKAQMQWLEPIVEQTGIPLSIALITNAVGTSGYCTWDELRRWRNMGFNFVTHMATRITEIDPSELPERFAAAQAAMEAHGMLDSGLFVLPNGSWDQASIAIVAQYFEAAFNTTARVNAPPVSNKYLLRRVTLDGGAGSLQTWKDWVDQTIQTRGWCVFYGHARGDVYTEEMRTAYIELVNYCKEKGVDILSVPDGWKYYKQFI